MNLSAENKRLVARAMTIIGPTARLAVVEQAIFYETIFIPRVKTWKQSGLYGVRTKQQKQAANNVAVAIRRLEIALKSKHLTLKDKRCFPMDEIALKFARERFEASAKTTLGPPKRTDFGKRRAALAASGLLQKHNLPVNVARRGKFCRLAALLYGDEKADLFCHCRAYKNNPIRA
jgi:hypothetical protein